MSDDLVIKITGDTEGLKKSFEDVKKTSEGLQETLKETGHAAEGLFAGLGFEKVAELSKEAFEVLKEQLVGSIKAYGEVEAASRQLDTALQNQGIFTHELKESYKEYAESVSHLTGIYADEITKAQAVAQTYLGQIPITEDLTKAIADLAVKEGSTLPQAAETLGKAIANGTGQLLRQGIQFGATDTQAQRYQKTLDFVKIKAGGFAESANQGIGSLKGLENAIKQNEEALGKRFAPAAEYAIKTLTNLIAPSKQGSEEFQNLKAALLVTALALTGIGVVVPAAASAFVFLKGALTAVNIDLSITAGLFSALGIGLVIFALTELILHWESVSSRVKVVVKGLVEFVSGAFGGLGKVINSALHFDSAKIKEGLAQIQEAFREGVATASEEIPKATEKGLVKQEKLKQDFADKEAKRKKESEANRIALQKAEDDAILLELQNASEAQIALKKREIETLKAIDKSRNKDQKDLLRQQLKQIQELEENQQTQDKERDESFRISQNFAQAKAAVTFNKLRTDLDKKQLAQIKAQQLTEKEVEQKAYADQLTDEVKAHNQFLEEDKKYGIAYAAINQIIQSKEVQGTKQATGELVQLTQSKHQTLKEIGKVASVAQISIKTFESAMNIFAGFSAIPIIGIPLGLAGAAAAVAFGAEQIAGVTSAQHGGLVDGVGYGDKMPYLLEPGELVTPKKNFEEVVSSVSAARAGEQPSSRGSGPSASVHVGFNGPEASRVLTVRQNEDRALGISRQAR